MISGDKENGCAVLFLGKANDWHTRRAADFCRRNFGRVRIELGEWGSSFPGDILEIRWKFIISYLSRWILPASMLDTGTPAINFHPGPPEYPGYGCNNFAIYEGAETFGTTCHHMAPKVDTGAIIAVARFPVLPTDTGGTLLLRTYDYQLVLFYDIVGRMIRGEPLPAARDQWTRTPFTRKDFAELSRIDPGLGDEEAARRRRAIDVSALRSAK